MIKANCLADMSKWRTYVESLDFATRFVTVSCAHLYGVPSPDSDVDLRGCHQLLLREVVGLDRKMAKPILYAYHGLLSGMHLLRTGEVEANLVRLIQYFKLPYLDELIACKTAEKIAPDGLNRRFMPSGWMNWNSG